MRRRDFIKGIVGTAGAWPPLAVRAQQAAMPIIGFLHSGSPVRHEGSSFLFRGSSKFLHYIS
jgi:hypothetical protein